MALFDPRIPTDTTDVVAVLEADTGLQLFEDARPLKATVSESAKLLTHPLEDGSNIVDHRIILPIGISLSLVLSAETYRSTYAEIRQAFRESTRVTIQTKADTYQNMYMQDIPHEEDPRLFDTITMIITLIESQLARTQIQLLPLTSVINPEDSSTSDRGEQTTTDAGERGTVLLGLSS